jgi:hypothetical protein
MSVAAPVPGLERAFEVRARLGPLEDHGSAVEIDTRYSARTLAGLQQSIFVASAVREADRVYYTAYRIT